MGEPPLDAPRADPLLALIRDEIASTGPISLARYMALCLGHPKYGYYRRADPLGAAGDFTTAPEVSQIFGELIGLWLAQCWRDQGAPTPAALVELGPGRATLMADALRAIDRAAPDFAAAARLYLVETSPPLRARQAAALAARGGAAAPTWLERFDAAPDSPLFLVANEFFDALPIHRFRRGADGVWRERTVALEPPRSPDDGRIDGLAWDDRPVDLETAAGGGPETARRVEALGLASIETCPLGQAIASEIGARLGARGGAALIVDYGYDDAMAGAAGGVDTLQAVQRHAYADPLATPGAADLTAHVDFSALAAAATAGNSGGGSSGDGATAYGPLAQGSFLRRLGAEARAAGLARRAPSEAEAIAAGLHRLTHPKEMGTLFKALALAPATAPRPAAF